jgi:PKD repeat protein
MPLVSMRRYPYLLLLIAIMMLVHPVASTEIAYAIGSSGEEKPVGQANITEYRGTDVISFTTSASSQGPSTSYKANRTVASIKDEIIKKINRGNKPVRDEGVRLARGKPGAQRSGPQRIDQICYIYDYMADNWTFLSDWKGSNDFQYSNYSLEMGKEGGSSGVGDCDDFSILLAALVESIGGTPRIVFAYSPTAGGHAYTEVYLGKKNDKDVDRMLKWLRKTYNVKDVCAHIDSKSDDVWLNMDWWAGPGDIKKHHPGGPFYQADKHIQMYNREDEDKTSLTPIENILPRALFNYSPPNPEVYEGVSFDASKSVDPDGQIVNYEWDFGDGESAQGVTKLVCRHVYSSSGKYRANLTVTDNEGDQDTKTQEISVKEQPPEVIGTYYPTNPKAEDYITFDASHSKDKRGQITEYKWDFDDGNMGYKATMKHQYADSGTYNVNLTVTNDRGIKNSSSIVVVVSQKAETTENETIAGVANLVVSNSNTGKPLTPIENMPIPPHAVPPSPESLGLVTPQASLSSQSPPSSEREGLIATNKASSQAAAPSIQTTATAMVVPQGVYAPNHFYVPYSPSTIAGCNVGQSLPMWLDVRGTGPLYVYEWYPNENLETSNTGYVSPGWQKNWFYGDVAGWHIIQYYCGGWSNYVYIYVHGSN